MKPRQHKSKFMDRWDGFNQFITPLAQLAQIVIAAMVVIGFAFTVLPIYQTQVLTESISRKELEMQKMEEKLKQTQRYIDTANSVADELSSKSTALETIIKQLESEIVELNDEKKALIVSINDLTKEAANFNYKYRLEILDNFTQYYDSHIFGAAYNLYSEKYLTDDDIFIYRCNDNITTYSILKESIDKINSESMSEVERLIKFESYKTLEEVKDQFKMNYFCRLFNAAIKRRDQELYKIMETCSGSNLINERHNITLFYASYFSSMSDKAREVLREDFELFTTKLTAEVEKKFKSELGLDQD